MFVHESRNMRLSLNFTTKIIIGLSLFMIVLQINLFFLNCNNFTKDPKNFDLSHGINSVNTVLECKSEIEKLKQRILDLEDQLNKYKKLKKYVISEKLHQNKESLSEANFLNRFIPRTEFEVIPFTAFTSQHLFGEIGFLSKKPASLPIGRKGEEMYEVLEYAIHNLNIDIESKADRITLENFSEGITRNDLTHGTVYDLYFRSNHSPYIFKRLKVLRPFTSLQSIGNVETIDSTNEWINLILPLAGRLDKFKTFLNRFIDMAIRLDQRVFLTIVYFGIDGQEELKEIMLNLAQKESFENYKVIFRRTEFNRGQGLQIGAESWKKGNVLMFFCDVDIYITNDFLERCRLHASPGLKVYYPIVFSQYNPEIIYGGQAPPPLKEQMKIITSDEGFWRDFGFGMTCQYRDDFFAIGGFDMAIKGWGGEDVTLFKQYIKSRMTVLRAYDRNLIHIYHPKNCRKTLSDAQFIACLQSKAASEGSHKQLGMLAFGSSLVNGKDPKWAERLKSSLNDLPGSEKGK